ncbi:Phage-related protein [Lactococcus lactis subsp. lactis NCDO 2118]|uniref:Phage-related protein n=1 Tax=Lactococcus lactis subsp. lactis NCDO 2118 TaxID=1117941 RepID=A0ABC8A5P4_LACLL|nr:hypothetical protein [Lactococcus lactis]AII12458.1 Phage-related protein [Lactococcus lactis subsp. lactis NCDO 2118]
MSELEKTAPNEIYLIVGDADKDCNFNELAEVTWADKPIYEETAIKYVKSSQLTIPKSIAEKIDKFIKVLHFLNEFEAIKFLSAMDFNGDRTPQWLKDNPMLVFAYLAGKALGVDLVKVGEG